MKTLKFFRTLSVLMATVLTLPFEFGIYNCSAQGSCNFNWSVTSGNCVLPVGIDFNVYNPPGGIDHYEWNFGDNTTATTSSTSISHNYNSGGPFGVRVIAYDSLNNSICNYLEWQNPVRSNSIPGIECAAWEFIGCPGDILGFRVKFNGGDDKVLQWDFGDGTVVPGANDEIVHTYDNPGNYVVTLTYNDDQCGILIIQTNFVVSTNYKYDLAPDLNNYGGFSPNDTICPGDEVEILVGGGGTFYWDMGDGNTVINNDAIKKHSYSDTGNYTVTVINTNGCGFSDTVSGVVFIQNNVPVNTVNFNNPEISPNTACPNDNIIFDFYNAGKYAGFIWNFGDGTYDSLNARASHAYSSIGTKNVSLTVINGCGNSAVFNYTISITTGLTVDLGIPPGFSLAFPDSACPGDKIYFLAGTAGITSWSWNYGDGNNSATPIFNTGDIVIFEHTYASTGTYSAILTVTNGCGSSDSASFPVFIGNNTPVQTVNLDDGETGFLFFSDISSNEETLPPCAPVFFWGFSGNSFSWDFGDGTTITSNSNIIVHSFSGTGTYTVQLTTENSCGNSRVFSQTIVIDGACLYSCPFDVTISTTSANCGDSTGTATAVASGGFPPYTFSWSNGDTATTASGFPAGLHYVSVEDSLGCVTYANAEISDGTGPVITVANKTDVSCFGLSDGTINISISGGTPPYSYLWSDGSVSQDLNNIKAGTYIVVVKDAGIGEKCTSAKAIVITQPDNIGLVTMTTNASCLSSDGNSVAIVSGGEPPYSYLWSTGSTGSAISNIPAGNYSVAVSDANGCSVTEPVSVSNSDAPLVTLNDLNNTDCSNQSAGNIDINVSGGVTPYTYNWSDGSTAEDVSSLVSGIYYVTVTDSTGCLGVANFEIEFSPLGNPTICLITVDTVTGKNIIVWEPVPGAVAYNIYKEITQANVFVYIANVPDSLESEYSDPTADPKIRSWRYRLTAIDACGNESDLSPLHKTMHLTVNKGINGEANLIWDSYEGFPFTTYVIARRTPFTSWKILDSIPNNLHSYTDLNPPDTALFIYYHVRAILNQPCTTGKIKTYNASKSNTANMSVEVGNKELVIPDFGLQVYPNPTKGDVRFTIYDFPPKEDPSHAGRFKKAVPMAIGIKILNVLGQEVFIRQILNQKSVILNLNLPKGMYFYKVTGGDETIGMGKIVIE